MSEDIAILQRVLEVGKKWSDISKCLSGRNENSVKNRFFSLVKKEKKGIDKSSKSDEKISCSIDSSNMEIQPKEDEIIRKILKRLGSQDHLQHKNGMNFYL